MKHIRDETKWQHESKFTCKVCGRLVEGFMYITEPDGPSDCPGHLDVEAIKKQRFATPPQF